MGLLTYFFNTNFDIEKLANSNQPTPPLPPHQKKEKVVGFTLYLFLFSKLEPHKNHES
jgi:hypothetical protein